MITEFMLKNKTTLQEVKFGQELDCSFLYHSVDWGNVSADHNTYSYPGQVGCKISSTKLQNRDISIEAYAYYILTDDEKIIYDRSEWDSYAYDKIKEKKDFINNLINPQDYLRITIGDYYIEGKPSASPQFAREESENNIYFCKFMFNIFCDDPMFHKLTEINTVVNGNIPTFNFPFILEPDGYIMSIRVNYLLLVVNNEGNSKIGAKFYLKARDVIVNPSIENVTTGESFKINKTMQPGEEIIVDTTDSDHRGVYGDSGSGEEDYLQYWDFENADWIKFIQGINVVGYSTENQMESALDVSIDLSPEKFAVEEI